MKKSILFFLFLPIFTFTLITCASNSPSKRVLAGKSEPFPVKNEIIVKGFRVVFSDDWLLQVPKTEDGTVLFAFDHVTNDIHGIFSAIRGVREEINDKNLGIYFKESVLGGFKRVKEIQTTIDGKESRIFYGEQRKRDGNNAGVWAVIPGPENLVLLEAVGPKEEIENNLEKLSMIMYSIRGAEEGTNVRLLPEGMGFHNFYTSWRWMADLPGGFLLAGEIQGTPVMVSISRERDAASVEKIPGPSILSAKLVLHNRPREIEYEVLELENGSTAVIFSVLMNGIRYYANVIISKSVGWTRTYEKNITEELLNLFQRNIVFGPGK